MHDGDHVLHHFLFRGQALMVQYKQLATMFMRDVFEPFVPEARQAIPVRQHQGAHLASPDRVGQLQQARTLEIEPAADLFDELNIRQSTGCAKFFQNPTLITQVRLLRSTGHPTVPDDPVRSRT
ncbi:hypothetical protein NM04_12200 [Massilia aurea]|uniref:Uncharacterized protein n=1 Tax=Massilia aurea TaxID=373040 RepID=A0A422QKJ9_9BURK|nr:hypothetical protein NM04_12200 [Massilia aurea]